MLVKEAPFAILRSQYQCTERQPTWRLSTSCAVVSRTSVFYLDQAKRSVLKSDKAIMLRADPS